MDVPQNEMLLKYKYCIYVTILYFVLYYGFMQWGMSVKLKSKKEKDAEKKKHMLYVYERTLGNCLEQMPPFLVSFWMYAVFVDPISAAKWGLFYVVVRAFYPLVYIPRPVVLVTLPNYAVIFYFLYQVGVAAYSVETA